MGLSYWINYEEDPDLVAPEPDEIAVRAYYEEQVPAGEPPLEQIREHVVGAIKRAWYAENKTRLLKEVREILDRRVYAWKGVAQAERDIDAFCRVRGVPELSSFRSDDATKRFDAADVLQTLRAVREHLSTAPDSDLSEHHLNGLEEEIDDLTAAVEALAKLGFKCWFILDM